MVGRLFLFSMVDTLEPYNVKLQFLQGNIITILKDIFTRRSKDIVTLLQDEQLSLGLDGDGNELGVYSLATELIARFESPKPIKPKVEGKPYNLEWSGKWFKAMVAKLENNIEYDIFSSDFKDRELRERYGDNITKMSAPLNKFVNDEILKPELYQYFLTELSEVL